MDQMIIFVYDTDFCQTEADDPQKAVLFFHPHWVSDQQRLALCGQLMGAAHFCSSMFSFPRVLTLQCGKFVLKKFGRYILSVGSDQTLDEWILQKRFHTLELFFQFYHCSFDLIFEKSDRDQENFSKKLTEILEVYIPALQYVISSLGNVYTVKCPKRRSDAFLEADQLLEACCAFNEVLGGTILYNSRILATQLEPAISKILALTDSFRIRTHSEQIQTPFNLPVGVQFLKIYLNQKSYKIHRRNADRRLSAWNAVQIFSQKTDRRRKESNKMYTVQEEGNTSKLLEMYNGFINRKIKPKVETTNFLRERSKSFVGGFNLKVCSTPTVEKTLIHEDIVSICSTKERIEPPPPSQPPKLAPDLIQDALKAKLIAKFQRRHYISLDDQMVDLNNPPDSLPLRYFRTDPVIVPWWTKRPKEDKRKKTKFYKTLADPMYPLFRRDGLVISKYLHNKYLFDHHQRVEVANITIDTREAYLKSKYPQTNKSTKETKEKPKLRPLMDSYKKETPMVDIPKESATTAAAATTMNMKGRKMELTRANQSEYRKCLSLPLQPLSLGPVEHQQQNTNTKNKVLLTRTPTTPLTTKLSLLAFEENIDTKSVSTPTEHSQLKSSGKNTNTKTPLQDYSEGGIVPCCLFVYAHQHMTILLVLDEEAVKTPDLILTLWELCTDVLKKVELITSKALAQSFTAKSWPYSFLAMDDWTIQSSGPWGDEELKVVGALRDDMLNSSKVTEIIIRNEDSVVYGYNCGGNKVFYQQSGCSGAGLPTPADLMGTVTLKARRRLERDKDIVLL